MRGMDHFLVKGTFADTGNGTCHRSDGRRSSSPPEVVQGKDSGPQVVMMRTPEDLPLSRRNMLHVQETVDLFLQPGPRQDYIILGDVYITLYITKYLF